MALLGCLLPGAGTAGAGFAQRHGGQSRAPASGRGVARRKRDGGLLAGLAVLAASQRRAPLPLRLHAGGGSQRAVRLGLRTAGCVACRRRWPRSRTRDRSAAWHLGAARRDALRAALSPGSRLASSLACTRPDPRFRLRDTDLQHGVTTLLVARLGSAAGRRGDTPLACSRLPEPPMERRRSSLPHGSLPASPDR